MCKINQQASFPLVHQCLLCFLSPALSGDQIVFKMAANTMRTVFEETFGLLHRRAPTGEKTFHCSGIIIIILTIIIIMDISMLHDP